MRQVRRKVFQHPSEGRFVNREVEEGWWFDRRTVTKRVLVHKSLGETIREVMDFVNSIGPDRLINVCEYTTARNRIGDDQNSWFVVWYWEENEDKD